MSHHQKLRPLNHSTRLSLESMPVVSRAHKMSLAAPFENSKGRILFDTTVPAREHPNEAALYARGSTTDRFTAQMTEPAQTEYGLEGAPSESGRSVIVETASKAGKMAQDKMGELRSMASEGYLPLRVLAQIGGLAMIVLSIMGFVTAIIHLNFLDALVEVYTFLLGLVVVILETKAFPKSFEQRLNKYALFLRFVWGRGCLYFVAGSLQATQGKIADITVGCYMILVGIMYIVVGKMTASKLSDLRKSLISEEDLRRKFQDADVDDSGTITMGQFKNLTLNMGLDLNRREVEAAWMYLDKEGAGEISYEEFQSWWVSWDASDDTNGGKFEFV